MGDKRIDNDVHKEQKKTKKGVEESVQRDERTPKKSYRRKTKGNRSKQMSIHPRPQASSHHPRPWPKIDVSSPKSELCVSSLSQFHFRVVLTSKESTMEDFHVVFFARFNLFLQHVIGTDACHFDHCSFQCIVFLETTRSQRQSKGDKGLRTRSRMEGWTSFCVLSVSLQFFIFLFSWGSPAAVPGTCRGEGKGVSLWISPGLKNKERWRETEGDSQKGT